MTEGTTETQDPGPVDRRRRVMIYGSCVSRDSFEFFDRSTFELHTYYARHSLISAFAPVPADVVANVELPSRFQRRMLANDATSAFVKRLRRQTDRPDHILWDLVDERLGVVALPGGGYLTVSNELLSGGVDLPSGTRHIAFGTDEHFELWSEALESFRRLLMSEGLLSRTVLFITPWATRTSGGEGTPPSHGMPAAEGNALFERYHRSAEALPHKSVLAMAHDEAVAADQHRWGPAPFHFTDDYYRLVAARFESVTATAGAAGSRPG